MLTELFWVCILRNSGHLRLNRLFHSQIGLENRQFPSPIRSILKNVFTRKKSRMRSYYPITSFSPLLLLVPSFGSFLAFLCIVMATFGLVDVSEKTRIGYYYGYNLSHCHFSLVQPLSIPLPLLLG